MNESDKFFQIMKDVLARIKPSYELSVMKRNIAAEIIEKIKSYNYNAELVGSVAKDTDLKEDTDIDIFVKFPLSTKKEEMKNIIIEIGKEILNDAEIDYAEHPYVKGKFKNFLIEIVPCYDLGDENFENLRTSVDRTIYHTKYIKEKLNSKENLKDEIRILKQFIKGHNIYGAEASVKGFSGYLVELLCIYYNSFINVIKNASNWKKHTFIDIENLWEGKGKILFNDPLIVIDPVDKYRNVASALSEENMAKFIYACRKFLLNPSLEFFFPEEKNFKREDVLKGIRERKTKFIGVKFKHHYININNLYPQLEKTQKALIKGLENFKFNVMNSIVWTNKKDKSIIIFEFEVFELPCIEKIEGPPIDADLHHQDRFIKKHKNVSLEGWRWIAYDERKFKNGKECLKFLLTKKNGFGKEFLNLEWEIVEDEKILNDDTVNVLGKMINL